MVGLCSKGFMVLPLLFTAAGISFLICLRDWQKFRQVSWAVFVRLVPPYQHLPDGEPGKRVPASPPRPVDLRGEILELYFRKRDDILSFPSQTTVVMKVQVVNHGPQEATITHLGLEVCLGRDQFMGTVVNRIPETWRIKRRDEGILAKFFETPSNQFWGYIGGSGLSQGRPACRLGGLRILSAGKYRIPKRAL